MVFYIPLSPFDWVANYRAGGESQMESMDRRDAYSWTIAPSHPPYPLCLVALSLAPPVSQRHCQMSFVRSRPDLIAFTFVLIGRLMPRAGP